MSSSLVPLPNSSPLPPSNSRSDSACSSATRFALETNPGDSRSAVKTGTDVPTVPPVLTHRKQCSKDQVPTKTVSGTVEMNDQISVKKERLFPVEACRRLTIDRVLKNCLQKEKKKMTVIRKELDVRYLNDCVVDFPDCVQEERRVDPLILKKKDGRYSPAVREKRISDDHLNRPIGDRSCTHANSREASAQKRLFSSRAVESNPNSKEMSSAEVSLSLLTPKCQNSKEISENVMISLCTEKQISSVAHPFKKSRIEMCTSEGERSTLSNNSVSTGSVPSSEVSDSRRSEVPVFDQSVLVSSCAFSKNGPSLPKTSLLCTSTSSSAGRKIKSDDLNRSTSDGAQECGNSKEIGPEIPSRLAPAVHADSNSKEALAFKLPLSFVTPECLRNRKLPQNHEKITSLPETLTRSPRARPVTKNKIATCPSKGEDPPMSFTKRSSSCVANSTDNACHISEEPVLARAISISSRALSRESSCPTVAVPNVQSTSAFASPVPETSANVTEQNFPVVSRLEPETRSEDSSFDCSKLAEAICPSVPATHNTDQVTSDSASFPIVQEVYSIADFPDINLNLDPNTERSAKRTSTSYRVDFCENLLGHILSEFAAMEVPVIEDNEYFLKDLLDVLTQYLACVINLKSNLDENPVVKTFILQSREIFKEFLGLDTSASFDVSNLRVILLCWVILWCMFLFLVYIGEDEDSLPLELGSTVQDFCSLIDSIKSKLTTQRTASVVSQATTTTSQEFQASYARAQHNSCAALDESHLLLEHSNNREVAVSCVTSLSIADVWANPRARASRNGSLKMDSGHSESATSDIVSHRPAFSLSDQTSTPPAQLSTPSARPPTPSAQPSSPFTHPSTSSVQQRMEFPNVSKIVSQIVSENLLNLLLGGNQLFEKELQTVTREEGKACDSESLNQLRRESALLSTPVVQNTSLQGKVQNISRTAFPCVPGNTKAFLEKQSCGGLFSPLPTAVQQSTFVSQVTLTSREPLEQHTAERDPTVERNVAPQYAQVLQHPRETDVPLVAPTEPHTGYQHVQAETSEVERSLVPLLSRTGVEQNAQLNPTQMSEPSKEPAELQTPACRQQYTQNFPLAELTASWPQPRATNAPSVVAAEPFTSYRHTQVGPRISEVDGSLGNCLPLRQTGAEQNAQLKQTQMTETPKEPHELQTPACHQQHTRNFREPEMVVNEQLLRVTNAPVVPADSFTGYRHAKVGPRMSEPDRSLGNWLPLLSRTGAEQNAQLIQTQMTEPPKEPPELQTPACHQHCTRNFPLPKMTANRQRPRATNASVVPAELSTGDRHTQVVPGTSEVDRSPGYCLPLLQTGAEQNVQLTQQTSSKPLQLQTQSYYQQFSRISQEPEMIAEQPPRVTNAPSGIPAGITSTGYRHAQVGTRTPEAERSLGNWLLPLQTGVEPNAWLKETQMTEPSKEPLELQTRACHQHFAHNLQTTAEEQHLAEQQPRAPSAPFPVPSEPSTGYWHAHVGTRTSEEERSLGNRLPFLRTGAEQNARLQTQMTQPSREPTKLQTQSRYQQYTQKFQMPEVATTEQRLAEHPPFPQQAYTGSVLRMQQQTNIPTTETAVQNSWIHKRLHSAAQQLATTNVAHPAVQSRPANLSRQHRAAEHASSQSSLPVPNVQQPLQHLIQMSRLHATQRPQPPVARQHRFAEQRIPSTQALNAFPLQLQTTGAHQAVGNLNTPPSYLNRPERVPPAVPYSSHNTITQVPNVYVQQVQQKQLRTPTVTMRHPLSVPQCMPKTAVGAPTAPPLPSWHTPQTEDSIASSVHQTQQF